MSQITEINSINIAELLDFKEMVKQDPTKDVMNHKHFLAQMIYLALVMLLLGACSAPQPTPTVAAPTMTPPVEVTSDVVYATLLQPDMTEQRLDVYTPKEAGTWPVIVFLHGFDATKEGHIKESQAIAEQGAVVFTVNCQHGFLTLPPGKMERGSARRPRFCRARFALLGRRRQTTAAIRHG